MKKSQVEKVRDTKPRRRKRVGAKREKGVALVINTERFKYSDVLKAMRSDAKLVDLGVDECSIRRTRTGEMILELKRDKERKGAAYKKFKEEVLGEGVEVRAFTQEATQGEKPRRGHRSGRARHDTAVTVRDLGGRRSR